MRQRSLAVLALFVIVQVVAGGVNGLLQAGQGLALSGWILDPLTGVLSSPFAFVSLAVPFLMSHPLEDARTDSSEADERHWVWDKVRIDMSTKCGLSGVRSAEQRCEDLRCTGGNHMEYLPRIADGELSSRLKSAGAVLIEGPKACGKTATARRQAASEVRLDVDAQQRAAAEVTPDLVLDQPAPLLIDEWQLVPDIWAHVRRAVDDRGARGQFILTGSATPSDDAARHSGAGRIGVMRMRPMCLAESGSSSAAVSLDRLLDGATQNAQDPGLTVAGIAEVIAKGGWPALLDDDATIATESLRDYLTQVSHVDVPAVSGKRRDPAKVNALMRSLARNTATEVTITTLAADAAGSGETMNRDSVTAYLDALDRLMVIEDQPAWSPALRSRVQLRSSPRRHFVDPSLAVAALRVSPERLLADLEWMGLLFESMVIRDLRVLSQPLDGRVLHYRDNKGLEVDAVVMCDDGRWGAFEIKLGSARIDDAAGNLLAFAKKVDTTVCGEPGVLAVVTGTGLAYRRKDGVHVLPIGTLGP